MAYFPAFIDMDNTRVLVIGGGNIAAQKLTKLLNFTEDITIIALDLSDDVSKLISEKKLKFQEKAYSTGDINGFDIVVVATNTVLLHKEIYNESRGLRILVNSVDNTAYCDFIFPSYLQKGDLTVAFSTGGASPAFSKKIRQYFEKNIPDSVDELLIKMKELRKSIPKGKYRMQYFEDLIETYFSKNFK